MPKPGFLADRARFSALAASACCALFAALALWLLLRVFVALWPHRNVDAAAVSPMAIAATPAAPLSVSRFHFFGMAPPRPGSGASGAPASTTGLILRGTLADRDPKVGVAVLDGAGDGERAFRVGDEVLGGVKLAAVYADRIVLSRGGAEETLRLTRDTNPDPGNIVRPTPATVKGGATMAKSTPASGNIAAPAAATTEFQRTVARLRDNPAELMQRVQIVPVLDNGKLSGVRVSANGADAALLAQAGLQAGDVVTAVNGQRVESLERGQQIVAGLSGASSVRVTVLRNGKPTDVTVSLR